jgi:hypothetical protein
MRWILSAVKKRRRGLSVRLGSASFLRLTGSVR